MTRPHLIAKLILAAIGIDFLMHSLSDVISIFATLQQNCPPETLTIKMFIDIVKTIITLALSLILLFRSGWLVTIIAGQTIDQCETVSNRWVIAGYRITACFCGLLILYHRIELLSHYIQAIRIDSNILPYTTLEGLSSLFSNRTSVAILVEIIKWIIAIYLIFGAPHYVSRQMRAISTGQGVKT